jgi:DNA-binding NarL/FixJ family response regulator
MDIELSTLTMEAVLTQLQALAGLSGGQLDVAERIIMGETDKDIAERLGCSERTAKRKVAEVVHKCGAPTRSGILAGVLRNGST